MFLTIQYLNIQSAFHTVDPHDNVESDTPGVKHVPQDIGSSQHRC